MLECVINISEGRDPSQVARIADAAGSALLDIHSDQHHNRSVLTVVGEEAARAVASSTIAELDLRTHEGVHPRLGVLDVVPFVALPGSSVDSALQARNAFAHWLADHHDVPCFLYGPERALPDVRRHAFRDLAPDAGPLLAHPTAGAAAVGQRSVLIAYNVWVAGIDLDTARQLAASVRGARIRALGLAVGERFQVSMNLIDPTRVGPAVAYDAVVAAAALVGATVEGAELVGLLPQAVLADVPQPRWAELDVGPERTIEARLEARGLR